MTTATRPKRPFLCLALIMAATFDAALIHPLLSLPAFVLAIGAVAAWG